MNPKRIFQTLSFVLFIFFWKSLWASDPHGEAPPPAEGTNGKSASKGAKKGEKVGDLPEWFEIQTQLTNIQAKIVATEQTISKLLEHKQQLKNNSVELKKVVDELIKEHNELKRLIDEYEKKNAILKYRFPERGTKKKERTYQKMEVQSLEEMEVQFGTEGRIKRNLERLNQQYRQATPELSPTPSIKKEKSPIEEPLILRK